MIDHRAIEKISLVVALSLTVFICIMIQADRYTPWLAIAWALSAGIILFGTSPAVRTQRKQSLFTVRHIAVILLLLLPVGVRVINYQPDRIHGDDLLTATFSQNYQPLTTNFFSGVPDETEWVAKFPTPYFLFQKIFLRLSGATILTVKLSVLPYVLIVSLMTYLIGSILLGPVAGMAAVVIYAFMAVSIYHETLGLHFISSTAIYMVFFYTTLRALQSTKTFWHLASGITCGLCYLSYTSSYIAFPILTIALISGFMQKKSFIKKWAIWSFIGISIILMPFFTYAVTHENYFSGRIGQVSLLTGSWSAGAQTAFSLTRTATALYENMSISLTSLVKNGIGGHGGYVFNRQAFFHPTGLVLFLSGLLYSLFFWRKQSGIKLVLWTILLTFLAGMVLTIPPPAYHRLTLAFPFIAIISAIPFAGVSPYKKTAITVALILLAVYAGTNFRYAQTAMLPESLIEDAAIIRHINALYPNRKIHIAAFPSFALGKFFPFFDDTSAPSIDTKFHKDYLTDPAYSGPFLFVITLPKDFRRHFEIMYPTAEYIPFSEKYGLLVN